MVATLDSAIGRIIADRYEVLAPLKEGGMGRVYVALQRSLNRKVALKLILPGMTRLDRAIKRFFREARAASQLNHPNIVSIFDFGQSEGAELFLVMELLTGADLRVLLDSGATLPSSRIVDIVSQLLAGLAEAHDQNIAHRDIKPENIFLQPTRRGGDHVKLIDFGVARVDRAESITLTGQIVGTPFYGAPEQVEGEPGPLADLYSVGVVLYEMLTGVRPFESSSVVELLILHRTAPRPDPRARARSDIPAALAEVCMRAMAVDPRERFANAEAMADALKAAASSPAPPVAVVVQIAAPQIADFGHIDTIAPPSSVMQPEPQPVPAPVSPRKPGTKTVLVVEDDPALRKMLVRMLDTRYTVYEAEDGLAATALLARMPLPDVVVSDVMMPRMDGLSLARHMKADATLKAVPIILLTARDEAKDVVSGIQAGARHYLTKPIQMKELLARVAKITGERER